MNILWKNKKEIPLNHPLLKKANFIDGKWLENPQGPSLKVFHKYSQEYLYEIPFANQTQVETAIQSSVKAYKVYRKWSAGERAGKLQQLHSLLLQHKDFFTDLIIQEAGKPQTLAAAEIDRALLTLAISASEAIRLGGEYIPLDFGAGEGKTAITKRFPLGVIACITPFNFPLNLLMHKIAPALATGNSVIIKPPPQSPLCALALTSLLSQVGYPDGLISLVNCEVSLAEKLVTDERIAMVSFTGSDKVGWYLKNKCGRKRIALELGGNAAIVVDEFDHMPNVAKTVAMGAFSYAGQICISTQRIFVNGKIYDQFLPLLLEEIRQLGCGNPHEKSTIVGPMIDKKSYDRVIAWVEEAKQQGAKVLTNGKADETHHVLEPILLTQTKKEMKVVSEEVFGPLAIIEKYESFSDALKMVNDSRFGLQTGIFSNKIDVMKMALDTLEVGGIIMNHAPGFRIDSMPYGGVKESGLGREGVKYAMEEMTEPRLIVY